MSWYKVIKEQDNKSILNILRKIDVYFSMQCLQDTPECALENDTCFPAKRTRQ